MFFGVHYSLDSSTTPSPPSTSSSAHCSDSSPLSNSVSRSTIGSGSQSGDADYENFYSTDPEDNSANEYEFSKAVLIPSSSLPRWNNNPVEEFSPKQSSENLTLRPQPQHGSATGHVLYQYRPRPTEARSTPPPKPDKIPGGSLIPRTPPIKRAELLQSPSTPSVKQEEILLSPKMESSNTTCKATWGSGSQQGDVTFNELYSTDLEDAAGGNAYDLYTDIPSKQIHSTLSSKRSQAPERSQVAEPSRGNGKGQVAERSQGNGRGQVAERLQGNGRGRVAESLQANGRGQVTERAQGNGRGRVAEPLQANGRGQVAERSQRNVKAQRQVAERSQANGKGQALERSQEQAAKKVKAAERSEATGRVQAAKQPSFAKSIPSPAAKHKPTLNRVDVELPLIAQSPRIIHKKLITPNFTRLERVAGHRIHRNPHPTEKFHAAVKKGGMDNKVLASSSFERVALVKKYCPQFLLAEPMRNRPTFETPKKPGVRRPQVKPLAAGEGTRRRNLPNYLLFGNFNIRRNPARGGGIQQRKGPITNANNADARRQQRQAFR